MAQLDYLLLADYARADSTGSVTIVGANLDTVMAQQMPTRHSMALVGRIDISHDEDPVDLHVTIEGPAGSYLLSVDQQVMPPPEVPPGIRSGAAFASQMFLPLVGYGIYTVRVQVGDNAPKEIPFRVIPSPSSPDAP